jgi:hypothetical protein
MSNDLARKNEVTRPEVLPCKDEGPQIGEWYWVLVDARYPKKGKEKWLACVAVLGSNYAEMRGRPDKYHNSSSMRVHFSAFADLCTLEPEADRVIAEKIEEHRQEARRLMNEVHALTARLSVSAGALAAVPETEALALRSDNEPVDAYKNALVLAKEKTLPDLFKEIEEQNEIMGSWMMASLVPLKAQADGMRPVIKRIEQRIFNVELYAGLSEDIEQITEGEPAPIKTKLHLFQRRAYMDEECLAQYEAGGMEFADLNAFDEWLARPVNRDRILPLPRCIVAFQVRRHTKERELVNLRDFFRLIKGEYELDKLTFLYIRNGEQLFRLGTKIDFGAQLFPDRSRLDFSGKVWAKMHANTVEKIFSDGEYQAMREERKERKRKIKEAPEDEKWRYRELESGFDSYHAFDSESVYYDDIAAHVEEEMARHNRLVLVLQGLLDRSAVLHPHPPWQLWTPEGFNAALELIYDDSRTLTTGDAPDFEAYRAKCNASLKKGSVTVGQQVQWLEIEAEKENKRLDNDWRNKSDHRHTRYQPYGNPGPGTLARVVNYRPRAKTCTYEWKRERQKVYDRWGRRNDMPVPCSVTVDAGQVLNVDAYIPGDFHKFFDDPRTRADYLHWAPLLLTAEDFISGRRKIGGEDD